MRIAFTYMNGIGQAAQLVADIKDFNSEEFAKTLNGPQVQFISIGNNGFAKQNLISWAEVPAVPEQQ